MEEKEVQELVEQLSWNLPYETQNKALKKLIDVNPEMLDIIINPYLKSTWENAVKIIELIGYPKNKKALPSLIALLQDLNWPGALHAVDLLKNVEEKVLIPLIEDAIKEANESSDEMWLWGIKFLLERTEIRKEKFKNDLLLILENMNDY